jgi:hypothetical protein
MEKRYATQGVLSFKQAEALASRLMYSVEGISNCFLDAATQELVVGITAQSDLLLLDKTVEYLMLREKNHRIFNQRLYIESENIKKSSDALHDVEAIYAHDGSVRRDLAVLLFDRLDSLFVKLASRFEAELRKYPSMIPLQTLEKCRYIPSFPQNIHFVSEIPHQLEMLERVKEANQLQDITRLSAYALSPAVCFNCYEELSGSRLNKPFVLTARGICFRHEAPWRLGKHRLNEFSMREIVFVGHAENVESILRTYMDEVWQIFESLGLKGKIETANDPFFFSEDVAKSQHQLMANMKYELIAAIESESFSIASFNNMSDTLCKPFDICDTDGKPLSSGCIAFGIDRWVYALLKTYGPDLEHWPSLVRTILNK